MIMPPTNRSYSVTLYRHAKNFSYKPANSFPKACLLLLTTWARETKNVIHCLDNSIFPAGFQLILPLQLLQ